MFNGAHSDVSRHTPAELSCLHAFADVCQCSRLSINTRRPNPLVLRSELVYKTLFSRPDAKFLALKYIGESRTQRSRPTAAREGCQLFSHTQTQKSRGAAEGRNGHCVAVDCVKQCVVDPDSDYPYPGSDMRLEGDRLLYQLVLLALL